MQDLSHRVWEHSPSLLNFETSFGTLAWERGGQGRCRAFDRNGRLAGWARSTPAYDRIRAQGLWDVASPSLTWQVDTTRPDQAEVLGSILEWAEGRSGERFTSSHTEADATAAQVLRARGYVADPDEPSSMYLQTPLTGAVEPTLPGYRFTTMAELDDVDRRAEVHRLAWDGSTRSADDVVLTMATWPYRADLDVIAIAADGSLAGSAICWFDTTYGYGELEPVGTVPQHRGKGVASALVRFGLARLRQAGASFAVVGARADAAYPAPRRLYWSVGFRPVARQVIVSSPS